jgi:4-amino-4-deoxy-L-arabinose transferase-like glycosyltransferase
LVNLFQKLPNIELSKKQILILLTVFVVLNSLVQVVLLHNSGKLYSIPDYIDGWDYDNLAINISRGKGFGNEYGIPEWRETYIPADTDGRYSAPLASYPEFHLTTYRPPLYPFMIAGFYKIFDRQFIPIFLFQIILYSLIIAMVVFVSYKIGGLFPAIFTLAVSLGDETLGLFQTLFMTEMLAVFLATLYLVIYLEFSGENSRKFSLVSGILFGLLILTRSIFILWLPVVSILHFLLLSKSEAKNTKALLLTAMFVGVTILVITPWSVRNCLMLKRFAPFGTQSGANLLVDYSDGMLASNGRWDFHLAMDVKSKIVLDEKLIGLERDSNYSQVAEASAREWIKNNISKLPTLFWVKVKTLWWPDDNPDQRILIILSVIGFLFFYRTKEGLIFSAFLLANTVAVGLTHNHFGGRFLIPNYGVLYVLSGFAMAAPLVWLNNRKGYKELYF